MPWRSDTPATVIPRLKIETIPLWRGAGTRSFCTGPIAGRCWLPNDASEIASRGPFGSLVGSYRAADGGPYELREQLVARCAHFWEIMAMNGATLASMRMRYFEQVARSQSVRRAAETLNVSASAVNRQILMLENELGVALFERLPRGMRTTEAGNIILSVIRRFDQDYAAAISEIDALRNLRRGHVSVGTLLYLSESFVPDIITRMRKKYPNITYSAFFGTSNEIVNRVIDGCLDIGTSLSHGAAPRHGRSRGRRG